MRDFLLHLNTLNSRVLPCYQTPERAQQRRAGAKSNCGVGAIAIKPLNVFIAKKLQGRNVIVSGDIIS